MWLQPMIAITIRPSTTRSPSGDRLFLPSAICRSTLALVPERDYGHRDVVDKLGLRAGHAVALDERCWRLDTDLRTRIEARVGRGWADEHEEVDVVLVAADGSSDVESLLSAWRPRLEPSGGIWVLTPKRGQPGYVDQRDVMQQGLAAGLVDNKVCSVSDTVSALRFVIRRADRVPSRG